MAIKIYRWACWDRSLRVSWLLEEMGIPYEAIDVKRVGDGFSVPEFGGLTPMDCMPTVVDDDGTVLLESCALAVYYADKFSHIKKLAPAISESKRGEYLQWAVFAAATLDKTVAPLTFLRESPRDDQEVKYRDTKTDFQPMAHTLMAKLESSPYLLGEEFSAADIMVGFSLTIPGYYSEDFISEYPILRKYLDRLTARPAFKKVVGK